MDDTTPSAEPDALRSKLSHLAAVLIIQGLEIDRLITRLQTLEQAVLRLAPPPVWEIGADGVVPVTPYPPAAGPRVERLRLASHDAKGATFVSPVVASLIERFHGLRPAETQTEEGN